MGTKPLKSTDVLSTTESEGILALAALNKLEDGREVVKAFRIGNIKFRLRWRSSKCLMGRFGGGWQWALGFEASKSSLILHFLICSLMISRLKNR